MAIVDLDFEAWREKYAQQLSPIYANIRGVWDVARSAFIAGKTAGRSLQREAAGGGEECPSPLGDWHEPAIAISPRPTGTLQERLSQDTVLGRNVLPAPASAEPGEDDPGEFGAGIKPNPKARYWQERADFWMRQAISLGYVADDGTQRCPPNEARGGGEAATYAPWNDFAGNQIHDRDRIRHPDGTSGTVVWLPAFGYGAEAWRVVYDESGIVSRLALQIGDKGQAIVTNPKPASHPTPAAQDAESVWREVVGDYLGRFSHAFKDVERMVAARATTGADR
jgi:hypothetical protein